MSKPLFLSIILFSITLLLSSCAFTSRNVYLDNKAYEIALPVRYENLCIFPVISAGRDLSCDYATLQELQDAKLVVITECKEENVPTLAVHNKSDKNLILLGGEIVCGGKQDRAVQHDMIVPPRKTVDIKVKCVEQGRWSGKSKELAYSGKVADNALRPQMECYKQMKVWKEVRSRIQKLRVEEKTESGSYNAVISSEKVNKESRNYVETIVNELEKFANVCGVIVAVNGSIVSCDVFGSPALFEKYRDQLLDSYAVQALSEKSEGNGNIPAVDNAVEFLKNTEYGESGTSSLGTKTSLRKTRNAVQVSAGLYKDSYRIHLNSYRIANTKTTEKDRVPLRSNDDTPRDIEAEQDIDGE